MPAASPLPSPAGPGTRAAVATRWLLPGTLLILLVALFLRGQDLDGGRMSPDDGEFLHSARVHELSRGLSPGRWLGEDASWVGLALSDFQRLEGRQTFQHGYLHQLCIRYAARAGDVLGFGRVAALRLDQALLGALTSLLVVLWLRRVAPREPLVALAGGALLAVQLAHVLVSRTGWGQAACTFFLVWMLMIAWRLYTEAGEGDTWKLRRGAFGIAATSLLAYGFHEMATVYTFVLAAVAPLLFRKAPNGTSRWPWFSRRVGFVWLGCIPVGLLTVVLVAFSEYARTTWFSSSLNESLGWLESRRLSWRYLVDLVEVHRQISWPVLALAALGLAGAFTRDVRWAAWLVTFTVLPTALLFLRFNLPNLVRIYLPVDVLVVILAAEGLGVLWGLARHRAAVALADATAILAIGWCAAVTHATVLGGPDARLFLRAPHHPLPEGAHPLHPFHDIETSLRELAPTEPVAAAFTWGPLYRVLDIGLPGEVVNLDERMQAGTPPKLLIGPKRFVESGGRMQRDGGPYALRASDSYGSLGLYVREP